MTEVVGEGDWPKQKKFEKVKELEDKIKKLEKENKKLLYKVHNSPSPDRSNSRSRVPNSNVASLQNGSTTSGDDADELENGLLDINMLLDKENFREDEWLYVSPKLPPTPVQKRVTPREWLSEGHSEDGKVSEDLPSLDDVRKSLIYNIDEAENLGDVPSYSQTSNLKRRQAAGKRPPQRADNISPSPHNSLPNDDGEAIPVVKWKAKVPSESSPSSSSAPSEDDADLSRKWKVKQVPATAGGLENHHNDEEITTAEVAAVEGNNSLQRRGRSTRPAPQRQEGDNVEDVPVVRWNAKMPAQESPPSDVLVVKWKAKAPQETTATEKRAKVPVESHGSDVPVVKWKAKMPEDSDVPVVRRKAKMPEDSGGSDVPVVKWKARARVPESGDAPVVARRAKMPDDVQSSDIPVVKWKAKMPAEDVAPVVRRKAKMPEKTQATDVPVVKWKAKMPEDGQPSNSLAMRKKAKAPENHQATDVPVVKWKAKMPEDGQPSMKKRPTVPEDGQASDVPVVKWKAKMPQPAADDETSEVSWKASNPTSSVESLKPRRQKHSSLSPKRARSPSKVDTMPEDDTTQYSEDLPVSPPNSHQTMPSSSPPHSPTVSSTQLPESEPAPAKSLSRRSSFSESRSPSPPSISPQVRMAIASPILSRRTPSPSRSLAASLSSLNSRQSPIASPMMQQRHLHYISGGQQSPGTSRSFTGAPSPVPGGHVSRVRTPRSQQSGGIKTNSPMKGFTPPGERKHRRVLPSGPSSESVGRSNQRPAQHPSPGQGGNDDSWLEGCF